MRLLLCTLALLAAGCGDPFFVEPTGLAPGGGTTTQSALPYMDVVVTMSNNATGFNPFDLMNVYVNGVNRVDEMVIGGSWAVLRVEPAPLGTNFIELSRRVEPVFDTSTIEALPYNGPTLASVAPESGQTGEVVTITGTGFSAAPARVWIGGVETTPTVANDTTITAPVPAGALPGVVLVLIGADTAFGLAGFQPLDDAGEPVPEPLGTLTLIASFPLRGGAATVLDVYGYNFSSAEQGTIAGIDTDIVFNLGRQQVGPIEILRGYIVVSYGTPTGPTELVLRNRGAGTTSAPLPFLVD
ncbi:MAG: IPT/TIG domain-containing protein [Planctomycetota bacterium]|jgi:hypothetical protein